MAIYSPLTAKENADVSVHMKHDISQFKVHSIVVLDSLDIVTH